MSTVLVSEDLARRLLRDDKAREILPCLSNMSVPPPAKRGCTSCGKKSGIPRLSTINLTAVKRCIFSASPDVLDQLKKILKVDRIIIYFNNETGYPNRIVR